MSDDSDWLTWTKAAELVGCPVTTIETYVRAGRIERRNDRRQPSLKRESVDEFATWWREETARRDQRRVERVQRRSGPRELDGWIQTREAADILGYADADHIVWLVSQGKLEGRKVGSRWWVRESEAREYKRTLEQWVSHVRAAEIVGCSHETIRRAVNAGKIEKRDVHRTVASLSRASVVAFGAAWRSTATANLET